MITKRRIKHLFENKIKQKLVKTKKALAKSYVTEADLPFKDPDNKDFKVVKSRQPGGIYRFQFTAGRVYVVDLMPADETNNVFNLTVYVKGQEDSTNPMQRFGVTGIGMIQPLFEAILKCVDMFLEVKKPSEIRMVPGNDLAFPLSFHPHIFNALKAYKSKFANLYATMRGDNKKDNAAFVLKKSAAADNMKTSGWRPTITTKGQDLSTKTIGQSDVVI